MANQPTNETWFNTPLIVALVTIALTLVTTQVSAFIERWLLRRQRARSLKLAFQGEIYAVRGALCGPAKTAVTAWKSGAVLRKYGIAYPRNVFHANVGNLGDLSDAPVISQIVALYSSLERFEETAGRIQDGTYDQKDAFAGYVFDLVCCWNMAVLLDMRLRAETRAIADLKVKVGVSGEDAEETAFCNRIIAEIKGTGIIKKDYPV